jgi:RNA polymerase sigma factor (TIGR02999 family)
MSQTVSPTISPNPVPDLTTLLQEWRGGSGAAFSQLIDQVYAELKLIAQKRLGQFNGHVSLSPTDLLHEALIDIMPKTKDFKNRAHFFATISLAVRSILLDHARARATDKRGGERIQVTLTNLNLGESSVALDLLAIDQALTTLEKYDVRCAEVMHLTYFGGLEREDIAAMLNVDIRTIGRDLLFGRAWIAKGMLNDA